MLFGQADLCKTASKLELKELKKSKFHPAFMSELEALLLDVYASLLPTASEYEKRKQLILAYNMVVRSIFGNTGGFPVVEAFGSFLMDMFTTKSDLDLTINFTNSNAAQFPRDQTIFVLRRLAKVLYKKQRKGDLSGVFPVLQARVPVLKAVDCRTGIECDISVENKDGISRSLFFSIISTIDERFRIMNYLMKAWAKANDINSSKDGTLNSLSIISLVAFHFQTRDPPILPPFSALLRDGTNTTNLRNVALLFKNFGVGNEESVAELFVALLAKLSSVEKLWELGLCASTFEGSWISKMWGSKVGNMTIEDFLDRSQNFARAVGKSEMTKIYACLRGSLEHLSRSMQEQTKLSLLRSVLFGSISLEAQCTHIKSKAAMIMEYKLPTQSVQQIVDINNTDNHADRQKKKYKESTQLHVDMIITTNHAGDYSARNLKRKLPSDQPVDPVVDGITLSNLPSSNLTNNLERKLPGIESSQPHNKKPTPARAGHAKTAAASSVGSHQNLSNINLPPPVIYPVMSYVPPQPINVVGHPHMPFDPSGYLARSDPRHPTYASMAYGPHHNPLIYGPRYDPMAPVRLAYGLHGPHYVPNQAYPIFPGPTMLNTARNQQGSVPSRLFGSNHL